MEISCETCGNGIFQKYQIFLAEPERNDIVTFLQRAKTTVSDILQKELNERKGIKWFVCLNIKYRKESIDGETIYSTPFFQSEMQLTNYMYQIDSQIDTAFTVILTSAHNFQNEGSNWTFDKIISFDICITNQF